MHIIAFAGSFPLKISARVMYVIWIFQPSEIIASERKCLVEQKKQNTYIKIIALPRDKCVGVKCLISDKSLASKNYIANLNTTD